MEETDTLELKRQLIHLLNGSAITVAVYLLKPIFGLLLLAPLLVAIFALHIAPRVGGKLWIVERLMHHFERKRDRRKFPFKGAIFFGYGIIAPIALLDHAHAAAVILILAVGDSASTLIGRRWGRTRIGDKSFEGFLGFVVLGALAAAIFIDPKNAFFLALIGGLIELVSKIDDNLIIPSSLSLIARLLLL